MLHVGEEMLKLICRCFFPGPQHSCAVAKKPLAGGVGQARAGASGSRPRGAAGMAVAAAALGVWPTDSFCELIAVGALGLLLPWPGIHP